MEKKLRNKYFFWAIIFFGTLGVSIPIVMRIISKESDILILDEIVMNLSTYSVALIGSSIYSRLIKNANASLEFKNELIDSIGVIILAMIYIGLLNYLLSIEGKVFYWSVSITLLGCFFSWYLWFKFNDGKSFSTGSIGGNTY